MSRARVIRLCLFAASLSSGAGCDAGDAAQPVGQRALTGRDFNDLFSLSEASPGARRR